MRKHWGMLLLAGLLAAQNGFAQDAAIEGITAADLLKLLVDEGVIDKTKVAALAQKLQARQRNTASAPVEAVGYQQRDVKPAGESGVVRVPYVPQYIRDEIRDQVRIGLKEDVSRDVLAQAKQERWGLPGALPEWVGRIKLSGDVRLREEYTSFASGNVQGDYLDVAALNERGSFDGADQDLFLNTTEDRQRLRARLRLAMKAKVSDRVEVGARLVTGKQNDPVSTNQTLGSYGDKWDTAFDLAYLRYTNTLGSVMLTGGRIENPFLSTDLVWDSDLTFEGVAATWRWWRSNNPLTEEFRAADPYITIGAFPLQEVERSSDDKWLYGAQFGYAYAWTNQNRLNAALSYYKYDNIVGRRNAFLDDTENDFTAPEFLQKGNTLFNIRNSNDPNDYLFAHAADYELLNLTAQYDIANFAPVHVLVDLDYVKNIGYDSGEVDSRLGFASDRRDDGYQLRVAVGWPTISKARDWQVSFAYKYLERDAVLAAFTDSDFHLGGTDAEGYILKFDYGLTDNTWLTLRWLSSNEIDGELVPYAPLLGTGKLGVDVLQMDVNARF